MEDPNLLSGNNQFFFLKKALVLKRPHTCMHMPARKNEEPGGGCANGLADLPSQRSAHATICKINYRCENVLNLQVLIRVTILS